MSIQFADYAVEHGDLVNYLGFAEDVLFNVSRRVGNAADEQIYKHHQLEGKPRFTAVG